VKILNLLKRIPKTPEQRREQKIQLALGSISGVLMGLSFQPVPFHWFMFFALVPYLYVINKRNGYGEICRFTYFTAFIFNIVTLYWVGSWTPDADPFLKMAGSILMFWNPILFLIPSTLFYAAKKLFNKKIAFILFPLFWVSYEYVYSITEFRFPWLTLANSQSYFLTFIQIADIFGAYGLSLIILFLNVSLFFIVNKYLNEKKVSYIGITAAILLLIVPTVYGIVKISNYEQPNKKIKVGIIQPDLNPNKKWEVGNLDQILDLYLDMSDKVAAEGAKLILWPETALPVYLLSGNYNSTAQRIFNYAKQNDVHILTGMPDAEFYIKGKEAPDDAKPIKNSEAFYTSYNSILLFNPYNDTADKYGKIKLVPFGEKVPYVEDLPFLGDFLKWNVGISSWNTGRDTVVFNLVKDKAIEDTVKIGAVVCIESIYPDFVSSFVKRGAEIITVVTNDSWYGNSSGPYQHKEFSVLRAIENRRSLIRCANGGISCLINPLGNTIVETKMFERTTLVFDADINEQVTFYTKYPLLVPILCSIVSIWIFGIFLIKKMIIKFYPEEIKEENYGKEN
jgi:apolipoprotein N-acyltransferase